MLYTTQEEILAEKEGEEKSKKEGDEKEKEEIIGFEPS